MTGRVVPSLSSSLPSSERDSAAYIRSDWMCCSFLCTISARMSCADLIVSLGLKRENVFMCDSKGLIYEGRQEGMNEFKARYARKTDKRTLAEAMEGADIFFGLSTGDCVTQAMVKQMAPMPIDTGTEELRCGIKVVVGEESWAVVMMRGKLCTKRPELHG